MTSSTSDSKGSTFVALVGSKLIGKDMSKIPKAEAWACSACTLENEPQNNVCSMCNSARPQTKAKGGGTWVCSSCTLLNENTTECGACGGPRPSEPVSYYQDVPTTALNGMTLGLYFSAHWCPPCRGFTPELIKFYNEFKKTEKGKNFEIVFVSSDRDPGSFDEYFKDMPWLALPFSDRKTQAQLSSKFKVQGIPTLVILDSEGKVITSDGRSEVSGDPKAERFPWAPKSLFESLEGKFIDKDGKDYSLNDIKSSNAIGFYFSAHWCGPCQMFTPELVKFYNKIKGEGKSFEVVFVSSDMSEGEFNQYFGTMPWKALPFKDPRIPILKQKYAIRGIPSLVIVDNTGKLITNQGRSLVEEDPTGFPWPAKPLIPLGKTCVDALNSQACLLFFPSQSKFDEQKNMYAGIAETYFKKFEEKKRW